MKREQAQQTRDQFRGFHPLVTFICVGGIFGALPLLAFMPDYVPNLDSLGPLGITIDTFISEQRVAIRNTFLIIVVIHLTEAVIAMMMCAYMDRSTSITLQWGTSVFVHGIFSFRYLMGELYLHESQRQGGVSPEVKLGLAEFAQ